MAINIIIVAFVVLALFLLPTFFHLVPHLMDAVFRARGSEALEFSVNVARERNTMAYVFLIPAMLLMSRYRLYDPSFMQGLEGALHIAACAGVLLGYVMLRGLLYVILRPRRRYDYFRLAHRAIYTFFILFMLAVLPAVGVLTVFHVPQEVIRLVIYILLGTVYLLFLVRKTQILALSCSGLQTFSYLCGLEFLPTSLLMISAVVL